MSSNNPHPVGVFTGGAFGLEQLPGLTFRLDCEYTACLICGEVYQSSYDRNPELHLSNWLPTIETVGLFAQLMRKEWSRRHAKEEHTEKEHEDLRASGRFYTPEAAIKLAAFGLIDLVGLVMDDEIEDALRQSSPVPTNDARSK